MNEIDKQIAEKLAQCGWCAPMRVRMSKEDCEKIKNREPNFYADIDGPPPHCASCPGLDMNASQQKEMIMNQQQKSYTVSDIVKLSGISRNYLYVLKSKALRGEALPEGEAVQSLLKTFQDLGIDWCDIVKGLPGWARTRRNKTSTCQISQTDNSEAVEGNVEPDVLPSEAAELPTNEKEPESLAETILDSGPPPSLEQSVMSLLHGPAEHPKSDLGHLPLDLLVGEIVRRFPRAEIILR